MPFTLAEMLYFIKINFGWVAGSILGLTGLAAFNFPSSASDGGGNKVLASGLYRTIASLRGVNASGVADSLNRLVVITGTVHTINFRPAGLEFGLSDFSGGMHVFKSANLVPAYEVRYGDSIRIRGTITQFRGLMQILPDSISLIQNNRDVKIPKLVSQLSEETEGQLLRVEDLRLTSNSPWGGTTSYTAKALKGSNTTDTVFIRIDTDALITYPKPVGAFNLIGHGSQFATTATAPFFGGYQMLPRSNFDFSLPFQSGVIYAYVANISSDNVSVINTTSNLVTATIPVGRGPGGIAVSPNGTRIYTTNQGSYTLSVVDAASQSVIEQIPIGYLPVSVTVSPDGSRVYVASYIAGYVTVINALTNKIISRVFISQDVSSIAVSPDGSKLYVANIFEGKIVVLNATNFSVITQITVGTICNQLAISPDGTRLYATRYGDNILAVINTATNSVIANINLGSSADGVAVSPNGSRVYVSNMGSNAVSVINTTTNSVLTTIPISQGVSPDGISVHPDGSKVYVANPGSDNVSIINTTTNQVISTVSVGYAPYSTGNFMPLVYQVPCVTPTFSPNSLSNGTVGTAYSQSITQTGLTNPVFTVSSGSLPPGFSLSSSGELSGTPTSSGNYSFTVTATAGACTGNKSYILTINPNPGLVLAYIPNFETDSVSVINTSTYSVFAKIKVGASPIGVSVSPDGSRAYIANQNSDNVSVINTSTNAIVATISVGNAPNDLLVSPDGNRLYVLNYLGSSVSVINIATNAVITTINTPGNPKGVAISPDGSKLYIGHVFDGVISVINTATNGIINSIPSFNRPTSLAVNPTGTRLYVGHAISNNVRVFNTATNALVSNISVPGGVNGIAISPDGTRLYVTNNDVSNFVTVINTSTNSIVTSITTGIFPSGISVTPDGSKLLVTRADWTTGGATVISTASNSVITNIPIQGPYYAYGNSMPLKYVTCPTVTISPSSLASATVGSGFSQTFSQTGLASASFSIVNGALPAGLTLSSSGELSGTPTVSGTFTFTISANLDNCSGSKTYSLTVNCMVLAIPGILGNLTFCSGGNTILSVENPQPNTNYLWSNGTIANSIQVSSGGSFSVRAISFTCTSAVSSPVNTTVTPLPGTPVVTGALTFCAGSGTTLNVENPQANTTYLWNNGNTGSSLSVTAPGTYSVRAISNACTSAVSQEATVTVNSVPATPVISVTGNNTCAVALSTSGGVSYLWYLESIIQTVTSQTFLISSSGTYTVKAVSAEGCTSAISQAVSATIQNLLPAASISPLGATSFCQGDSVVLSAMGAAPGSQYTWSNGQGGSTLVVKIAGTYTVTYTNAGCNSLVSNAIVTEVKPLPTALISQIGNELIASDVPGANYQWLLNGQEIPGATQAVFFPLTEGNYAVRVVLNGCSAVSNVILFQFVGIENSMVHDVKMFPNPSSDWVEVVTSANGNAAIRITDQLGRQIMEIPFFTEKTRFQLPSGIYFVTIKTIHYQTVKKLVVR